MHVIRLDVGRDSTSAGFRRVRWSGASGRPEIIFLAFCVTVTMLLDGLTLPWVIRRLGAQGRESHQGALTEAEAVPAATQAALERLESASDAATDLVTARLRKLAKHSPPSAKSGQSPR
jgi:NhaP-type Na+/H+ or K+/H+ antiporter